MHTFTIMILFVCGMITGSGITAIIIGLYTPKPKKPSFVMEHLLRESRDWRKKYWELVRKIREENKNE